MKRCVLSSLAILCSLVGTLTGSSTHLAEDLKIFAMVFAGEFTALNESNPVQTILIYYGDLPQVAPNNSISLIMDELNATNDRIRVTYLQIVKERGQFEVRPYKFSSTWLQLNPYLTQEYLDQVQNDNLDPLNSDCVRRFRAANCPPYTGTYPGCTLNETSPVTNTAKISCSGLSITVKEPPYNGTHMWKREKRGCTLNAYQRPREDPCLAP